MSRIFDAGPLEQRAPVYATTMPPRPYPDGIEVTPPRAVEMPTPFIAFPAPTVVLLPEASRYQPILNSVEIPKMTSELQLYCNGRGPKECRFCAMRAATKEEN